MQPFTQDAMRMSLLFEYGVVSEQEVIKWADSQIIALDLPPEALIELASISLSRTEDIITYLHALSKDADFWTAFRIVLAMLYDYVIARPADAESIANKIFHTVLMFPDVPAEFSFAYRFDEDFSLARDGIFGDVDTVRKKFIRELQRFTAAGLEDEDIK